MAFKFEKLYIWIMAIEVATNIHFLTKSFPKEEMFSLNLQMKKAADSVALNIAEGSTGQSDAEQNRFLGYANRSCIEVVCGLHLAFKRSYFDKIIFDKHFIEAETLVKKIQSLRNYLLNNQNKNSKWAG